MLTSINPIGEKARQQPWTVTVVAFTVGSIAGGAAVGAVLGLLGTLVPPVAPSTRLVVVAGATLLAVVADAAGVSPPGLQRQVDRTWMTRYRGWVYGLGYGLQLGAAVTTYVTSWTTWLLLGAMVAQGAAGPAAVAGALHGAVRAASVWATRSISSPAQLRARHRRLLAVESTVRSSGHVALAVVATVALATTTWSGPT